MDRHSREPVKHTCPDIDKMQDILGRVYQLGQIKSCQETVETLLDIISDINYELNGMDTQLEKLRQSNDALRKWGISEAEMVDELEEKLSLSQ